ncbi:alpha/beta fold hydrolase [Streptomyces actinomycinicus]|uniref:Alpha/beta fold hydrolase n=1 Tax=Streptomyces actinomycinicus TaxID=1695166 RepID=A0A937EFF8_9ACTN|nr:alpha/beta fold hydrolase [Streptomyces actinomycinicus]MBL1081155.1 alpha/beta fold hydrolase [Streptomyces actinomycinicus]
MTGWDTVARADGLEVRRGPGQGPVLVAAHGIEDSWGIWRDLAEHLSGYRVYALQLPWHGGNSYAWRADGSPGEWLRRALELVPERPAALVGHSFGANAVLEFLARCDGDPGVGAAVLAAPFYRPAGFPVSPAIRLRSEGALRKVIRQGVTLALGPRAARIDPEIIAAMTQKASDRAVVGGLPVFHREFEASGRLDLSGIKVPTLVLAGVDDESLTPMRATALDRAMPAATVRLRGVYGHFCHVTQARELAGEADVFLRRILSAPPVTATATEPASVPVSDYAPAPESPHAPEFAAAPALAPAPECVPDPICAPASDFEEEGTVTKLLDGAPTTYVGMPRYEGANIRTWIGFKHFMYLAEEAVLEYFRERGVGARDMYHRYGLGLEIVDSSVQLPATLFVDDRVYATVVSATPKPDQGAPFTITLTVERGGEAVTVLKGKLRVALVAVKDGSGTEPVPAMLAPFVVPEVAALANAKSASLPIAPGQEVADVLVPEGSGAHLWSWRAPYYYCHFSDRLQHSAYVRTLEEVVDRFLHDRGLAIGKLLEERAWIPVVSRARVQVLSDIFMEETVHTVFTVEDVIKDTVYTARMDCYVRRGESLELAATATIMHGYAISRGEEAGTVALFDEDVKAALLGGQA